MSDNDLTRRDFVIAAGVATVASAASNQVARMMVAKGLIGNVTHIAAQWHRNPG